MTQGSIFNMEERVISDIQALLENPDSREADLRTGLESLLTAYQRLFKEEKKLIRLNDRQQNQMNRMNRELKTAKDIAEAASRSKGDFLANMSHEIRTPMNAIIGLTELALRTKLTGQQNDYLTKIESSAGSLLGIINDILDFSKIEVGKLKLETIDFGLNEVLENLTNLVAVKAEQKGLELLFNVDPSIPAMLKGDPLRLGQILINLTSNAVKFTEKGEILVRVEPERPIPPDAREVILRFSIQDTGIGLTQEQKDRLFRSFAQADQSTTRKYGGTGLGLNISKRLSEMMGGRIWVESEPGAGSTFSFTARFGVQTEAAIIDSRLFNSEQGLKILVVDDNAKSREILDEMLAPHARVFQAASADEAFLDLENAEPEDPFDLVLMDWKMPGMDGLEAIYHIRGNLGLARQPAIFLVTAYGREEVRALAEQADVDGFLIKPVTASLLFRKIRSRFGAGDAAPDRDAERISQREALKAVQGARILLVEDNEINQQVAEELLTQAGLTVSVADSGQKAVDAIQETPFDLIFMDIQMPDMDGYQTTQMIRNLETRLKQASMDRGDVSPFAVSPVPEIPIVAMTANAMVGDRDKCLDAGMNDYVTKPIDLEELAGVLRHWITPRKDGPIVGPSVGPCAAEPDGTVSGPSNAGQFTAGQFTAGPSTAGTDLPDTIPGIDIQSGLKNVGGNQVIYKKILMKFLDGHQDDVAAIGAALATGDIEESVLKTHTLKGVAGNIAAAGLYQAAAALESALRNNETDQVDLLLNMVSHKLKEVLSGLSLVASPAPAGHPSQESRPANKETVAALLNKLAGLVKIDMGEARDTLEELTRVLGTMPELDQIYTAFEAYEWDAVLQHIRDLARILDLPVQNGEAIE